MPLFDKLNSDDAGYFLDAINLVTKCVQSPFANIQWYTRITEYDSYVILIKIDLDSILFNGTILITCDKFKITLLVFECIADIDKFVEKYESSMGVLLPFNERYYDLPEFQEFILAIETTTNKPFCSYFYDHINS